MYLLINHCHCQFLGIRHSWNHIDLFRNNNNYICCYSHYIENNHDGCYILYSNYKSRFGCASWHGRLVSANGMDAAAECTPLETRSYTSPSPHQKQKKTHTYMYRVCLYMLYITLSYLKHFSDLSFRPVIPAITSSLQFARSSQRVVWNDSPESALHTDDTNMVYSSDFYTSRRPAYYKPSTSYSVTVSVFFFFKNVLIYSNLIFKTSYIICISPTCLTIAICTI